MTKRVIYRRPSELGAFADPAQLAIAVRQLRKATSKVSTLPVAGETFNDLLKKNNELLQKLLENSDIIRNLNTIASNWQTFSFDLTTDRQLIYRAEDSDRIAIFAHPTVAGEGTDICYIGNTQVTSTNGFPIIAGNDFGPIKIERGTEVWAVSDGTATLHLMIL